MRPLPTIKPMMASNNLPLTLCSRGMAFLREARLGEHAPDGVIQVLVRGMNRSISNSPRISTP